LDGFKAVFDFGAGDINRGERRTRRMLFPSPSGVPVVDLAAGG